ncbi:MAG: fluoride efflux transporter FluC [Acidimicrobiia bacterium]
MMVLMLAIGGGLGAAIRWGMTHLIPTPAHGFPVAITAVNVAGSIALGFLVGAEVAMVGSLHVGVLTVGVLGGFTTFSTWMVDIDRHEGFTAQMAIVLVPLLLGVAGAAIGVTLGLAAA